MAIMPGAEPFAHDGNEVGVLVCHGYSSTPQSMRPWAQHLADQGYTVRLPLLPGHGTTWQDLGRTRWTDWYAVLDREFADLQQRCEVVFTVGLSLGGLLATKLALDHGPQVRGVVLVNPIFKHNHPALPILPVLRRLGTPLVAITAKPKSVLAQYADTVLDCSVEREACPLNLAPTTSTTAQMALGDALAVALLDARGFRAEDFARSHPGGALGRKLLTLVSDVIAVPFRRASA